MNVCAARQQILNGPQFATLFHEIGPLHDLDIWLGKKLDRRKGLCNRTRPGCSPRHRWLRKILSYAVSHWENRMAISASSIICKKYRLPVRSEF